MKKNILPLLGIAFVVAIISTAIFYGLISSKLTGSVRAKTGPPSSEGRLTAPEPAGGLGVVTGMRAVSVQVTDSAGVIGLLQPGDRVDIQAVYSPSGNPGESELRTVLQNIEVFRINPKPESSSSRPPAPVVTFLTTPADADVLALVDSGARVRIALRHPHDKSTSPREKLAVASLIRGTRLTPRPRPAATVTLTPVKQPEPAAVCSPVPANLGLAGR